jgi:cation diffusion facilitator CzcD-associated flavoprotein CzcO
MSMSQSSLLVIGAGPYGLSVAARAIERSIPTTVVGRPMSFWRDHMPAGMFLRSGADWHLDAAGTHTFLSFLETRGIRRADVDPIPVELFLDYTDWFVARKRIEVRDAHVRSLTKHDGWFDAELENGEHLRAERVVAAPGIAHFAALPDWARNIPTSTAAHTVDAVRFDDYAGQRVLIVGGRQSAYEWAALIAEKGAERVDVVHRHEAPRFDQVNWEFVDALVANSIAHRGWWRNLSQADRDGISRRFWEAGRLTLEYWLVPRLDRPQVHRWPGATVVEAMEDRRSGELTVTLSNSQRLAVDRVVFATGYRSDLSRIPYLDGVLDGIRHSDGYPDLDEVFQTSVAGLYMTGFVATRDFGPFFGFIRATPASTALIVEDLLRSSRS